MGVSVRLDKITKSYGNTLAVADISLSVQSGEFVSLLGPSGSGKSTLLLMIAGIVAPSAGALYFDGKPVTGVPSNNRGIGIVFQNYSLFPHLTVFENVAFPLRVRRVASAEVQARVAEALATVNLGGMEERRSRQLSGGQQQRVALARALIYRPVLLLLDEPLAALDKKLREQMQGEIRQLHRAAGVTTIHVTHDQSEAMAMSDRIAVMSDGHIVQIGSPREIYDQPISSFVADFIGESNIFVGNVVGTHNNSTLMNVSGVEVLARLDKPAAMGERVRASLRPERIILTAASKPVAADALRGTVVDRVFTGDSLTYRVRIGTNWNLLAKRWRNGQGEEFEVGDQVSLTWPAEDLKVLEIIEKEIAP